MSDVIDLTGSPALEHKTSRSSPPTPRDSTSGPTLQDQLVDAVANLPAERLRQYITQAIVENLLIAEGLEDFLLSRRGAEGVRVQRVARCGKCRGEFDPGMEREEGECRYHDGDFEHDMESDTWIDWDERCHGPMDSSENRKQFPEGFMWNCCEKRGRAKGCVRDTHEATRKRVRTR